MYSSPTKPLAMKPRALMCYICGREYGTTSLKIHLPQCASLWKKRENLKPRSERRPVPAAPAHLAQLLKGGKGAAAMSATQLQAANDAAYETYNEKAMCKCDNCGRTFLEERLGVHQRSCKPGECAIKTHALCVTSITSRRAFCCI
jgi:hypothetical protein